MTAIISAKSLSKVFRTEEVETTALDNVDMEVREGEFVAVMGPSGCGKSTLAHILGLVDAPSAGVYEFLGNDVASSSRRERNGIRKAHIGFIFQTFNLIDELTVHENVELPLFYNNVPSRSRKKLVSDVLEKLNIGHRAGHFPMQLSGGQQQRAAVARAVVNSPKLILADEPTGNLDSENGEQVMTILRGLNTGGSTIVMVTHSDRDAASAGRVVRLMDGKVVA